MQFQDSHALFIHHLQHFFGCGDFFLFAKGRVCLYAALRAMRIQPGDEIIVPGYTCFVVPAAIMATGAKPVFADIDPHTYNLTSAEVRRLTNDRTKALIVQHTYGIPCEMNAILEWADRGGIQIIEDCCHTFGSRYGEKQCGTFGSAAFFSGQWNKPFSTGLGGILLVQSDGVARLVREIAEREMVTPSFITDIRLKLQLLLHDRFVTPQSALLLSRLYRILSGTGLMAGSSSSAEFEGAIPANYFMGMARSQAQRGVREMETIHENIQHRKTLTAFYSTALPSLSFVPLQIPNEESATLLRYPVRVRNKNEILKTAERHHIEIGSWFETPLHPLRESAAHYGYIEGLCPQSERAARETVNLPTHPRISLAEAHRILDFLKTYAIPAA